jgi:hypothetical protein
VVGHLGQEVEHRQAHHELVWRTAVLQTERCRQRVPLRTRQPADLVLERRTELMQSGKWQLYLGLDTGYPRDQALIGGAHDIVEQGGLADSGLTVQNEHPTPAVENIDNQLIEHCALFLPAP